MKRAIPADGVGGIAVPVFGASPARVPCPQPMEVRPCERSLAPVPPEPSPVERPRLSPRMSRALLTVAALTILIPWWHDSDDHP